MWTSIWHAIGLKSPLLLLLVLLWWFIREEPDDVNSDDDGGELTQPLHGHHPRRRGPSPRGPRSPRRGPHGDPAPPAPSRVRSAGARPRVRQQH